MIRKGVNDKWMVWDRQKKGPARVGWDGVPATDMSEQEAMLVKEMLEQREEWS
jgi:hypothetical protein